MTVARALLILGMLISIAAAVVALRSASAKTAHRVQRLHKRQRVLKQRLWTQEMELARLRGPEELRRRADELGLEMVPAMAGSSAD